MPSLLSGSLWSEPPLKKGCSVTVIKLHVAVKAHCHYSDRRKSPTKLWSSHSTILFNSMILLLREVVGAANAAAVAS
ncbi:uncharacterized protein DS421_13g420770 [Arachis hypogaea]|nr:uncharacterized protein DS421_13g420770 [Arachis hypogaea]